jgi:hypothetical protein
MLTIDTYFDEYLAKDISNTWI